MTLLELGEASIAVELTGGQLIVYHGVDGTVLVERDAEAGLWDRLWDVLRGDE